MGALKDELGDLLLQVVYHARMAEEQGAFAFADVADAITAQDDPPPPARVRQRGRARGRRGARLLGAHQGRGEGRREPTRSRARPRRASLDDVPAALPALTRAVKLQDKAARVGFDWPSLAPVFDKLKEELGELEAGDRAAATSRHGASDAESRRSSATCCSSSPTSRRHLKVDPEAALRAANQKFIRRFRRIEETAGRRRAARPRNPTLAEMDRLWDQAKAEERLGR